jgi:DUF1016 N-terminal domain
MWESTFIYEHRCSRISTQSCWVYNRQGIRLSTRDSIVCFMKIKRRPLVNRAAARAPELLGRESEFREVVDLIRGARQRALQAVNTSLVALYWEVGRYISQKLQRAIWGEGVVDQLARYISRCHADLRGFERRNLFRMRQFYDAYKDHKAAAPLVRHISWSGNLLILSRCKSPEEREFYLRLAHREGWDKRETDRQLRGALFERAIMGRPKVSPAVTQLHPDAGVIFKDRDRANAVTVFSCTYCLVSDRRSAALNWEGVVPFHVRKAR